MSEEARQVGRAIDEVIAELLAAHDVVRQCAAGQSKLPGIIAGMVQLAIDRAMGRIDA